MNCSFVTLRSSAGLKQAKSMRFEGKNIYVAKQGYKALMRYNAKMPWRSLVLQISGWSPVEEIKVAGSRWDWSEWMVKVIRDI
ncbi:hypothetical protein Dimus_017260 [Dionaea muscipula]